MHRLALRPPLRALRLHHSHTRLISSTVTRRQPAGKHPKQFPTGPTTSRISAKATLDNGGVYTPSEFIDRQLEAPEVQNVISGLSTQDQDVFKTLRERLTKENGHSCPLAINDIGEFMERHGIDLDLPNQLFEPTNQDVRFDFNLPDLAEITYHDRANETSKTVHSIMDPFPHLDARDTLRIPRSTSNPYGAQIIARNHISVYDNPNHSGRHGTSSTSSNNKSPSSSDGPAYTLPMQVVRELYQSILIARTVKQQTGKGKIMRKYFLVCVGNGNGLVGYGEGKDFNARFALQKARIEAVKNMDCVERFEDRTLWTDTETKLGATRVLLRPRPVGFGLRCNPWIHQILRAAGFKDISAKVWGNRNKLSVIKAVFGCIQAGHAPPGMGDGVGGKGVRLSKGVGMQGKMQMERARGMKLFSLRK